MKGWVQKSFVDSKDFYHFWNTQHTSGSYIGLKKLSWDFWSETFWTSFVLKFFSYFLFYFNQPLIAFLKFYQQNFILEVEIKCCIKGFVDRVNICWSFIKNIGAKNCLLIRKRQWCSHKILDKGICPLEPLSGFWNGVTHQKSLLILI